MVLVVQVFPGIDGKIRSVDVKTAKGKINRSVQKLHRLEISSNQSKIDQIENSDQEADIIHDEVENSERAQRPAPNPSQVVTRRGRVIRAPNRLNIDH